MQKKYLTELEQSRLLIGVSKLADPLAQRDFHWIGALILTGMRIQEFSRLTVPMVQQALAVGWLVSPKAHCKGGKRSNEYMVTAQLRTHLEALVKLSHALGAGCEVPAEGQPLVWGRNVAGHAGPLSVRSYEARLKEWAVHAQLDPRISPHWLRHTRAMNIMRSSTAADPRGVVQSTLGHRDISSTGIYTQPAREDIEAALEQLDGNGPRRKSMASLRRGYERRTN